jgi:hypothetical protein
MKQKISALVAALALLTGCATSTLGSPPSFFKKTTTAPTFWKLIDSLFKQFPLTKEQADSILSVRLKKDGDKSSKEYDFFFTKDVILADGISISEVIYNIWEPKGPHVWMVLFNIAEACLTKEQVEARYGALELLAFADTPRHRHRYKAVAPWPGEINFEFHGDSPGCLIFVVFNYGGEVRIIY